MTATPQPVPRSIAVIGASTNPERYSHLAVRDYAAAGWTVWPVNPHGEAVAGIPGFSAIEQLPASPQLACLYVRPAIGLTLIPELVEVRPGVVWLNPGADGAELRRALEAAGLRVVEGCALVALRTGMVERAG